MQSAESAYVFAVSTLKLFLTWTERLGMVSGPFEVHVVLLCCEGGIVIRD